MLDLYMTQPGAERIELVILPSPADAFLETVFPQWPMARDEFGEAKNPLASRITLVSNPATWVCGDLVWGATSVDTIFHLNAEEASRLPAGEPRPDRFAALAAHTLEQRSFYPLYPAASPEVGSGASGVPLEVPQLWHVGMPCSPDVLLLPSRLGRPCVRVVGGATVAVNPGSLARNKSFAKIAVFPHAQRSLAGTDPWVPNDAPSRVRVDVEKLL